MNILLNKKSHFAKYDLEKSHILKKKDFKTAKRIKAITLVLNNCSTKASCLHFQVADSFVCH